MVLFGRPLLKIVLCGTPVVPHIEKFFKKLGFNGGDTEVMKCSEQLMEYFKKKNIQVQVVVINDGQDYVDINWKPSEEFHAIMLSQENYNLKEVVSKSGGLYQVFY